MTPQELKAWRLMRRLTQLDLAAYLKVTRRTITRWETSRTPMPDPLPLRLAILNLPERPTPETAPHLFRRSKLRARRYIYQGIGGAFYRSK